MKLFVVVLRYIQNLEIVDQLRHEHLDFMHECYNNNYFLLSGPMEPRLGGVILAQAESRSELLDILHQDPFYKQEIAEFSVYEFSPSRHHSDLTFFSRYL
ncbi:MAG: GTP cyclohydrolase [Candidatus Paracaedibacteraceae bacterium]|nr:GTP cyclohydrolase [Candidatus Paracaedibacteraceae bacterium]